MKFRGILVAAIAALLSFSAEAQQTTRPQFYNAQGQTVYVSSANPWPVTGSFSAAGFTPATTGTQLVADTNGETGSLPAGAVVAVFNTSTTIPAYCKLGASATTSDMLIAPSSWLALTVGAATQLTCITSSSTAAINMVGGSGALTGAGGGGGSGGGGGAVTMASGAVSSGAYSSGSVASGAFASGALASGSVASGAMVDLGAQADSVCGSATGTCSLIALTKYLNSSVNSAIPSGTNLIGDVNLRQGGTALSATNGAFVNVLQGNAVLSATNPSFSRPTDGTNAAVLDPCQVVAKTNFTGSQTSGTQIIAGTSAKKTYICSMQLIVQGADVVNIIAGTGSVCATGSSAVMGSTTAANGMSYAANGGFTYGNGAATVIAATAANADNVCITQSGSSRITYQGTYVQL